MYEGRRYSSTDLYSGIRTRQASDKIRLLSLSGLAPQEGPLEALRPRRHSSQRPERRRSDHATSTRPSSTVKRKIYDDRAAMTESGRPLVSRSISMREAPASTRPSLRRSHTSTQRPRLGPSSQPPTPPVREASERSPYARRTDRSPGLLSSIFSIPKAVEPEEQIECLTCLSDDIPISKSAKLACHHRMCHDCLRRIFTLSVTDPQHMPPKCCTSDHIPLKHVDKLFDLKFKMKWNKKYQEYTTKNRLYCPAKGCGEWIKPANIHMDTSGGANGGRKYGKCSRCKTNVCTTCNGKWHRSRECPKDEATARFAEIAKKEGWQRCYNCSATVELKEGCNHMTCRCRAEFCMICAAKWKSCDCPWFNYEAVENDRLRHMNVPGARREGANAPRRYQEEIDQRREQEQQDERMARRLQDLGLVGDDQDDEGEEGPGGLYAIGNAAGHYLNRDFIRRATVVLAGAANQAGDRAANRMVAEVDRAHRARRGEVPGANGPYIMQAPPPPPPNGEQPLRRHSTASRRYNNSPQTRPSERVVPRRQVTDYATEAARHRPVAAAAGSAAGSATVAPRPATNNARRHSAMAGLTRRTTEGRVEAWRRHVEEGGETVAV
ncbi:hypothetical protein MMC09_000157 [Bachmanniomyces sp. S44760]|nr:hypothetical protein [Bachmanniomyces sp. S44760]